MDHKQLTFLGSHSMYIFQSNIPLFLMFEGARIRHSLQWQYVRSEQPTTATAQIKLLQGQRYEGQCVLARKHHSDRHLLNHIQLRKQRESLVVLIHRAQLILIKKANNKIVSIQIMDYQGSVSREFSDARFQQNPEKKSKKRQNRRNEVVNVTEQDLAENIAKTAPRNHSTVELQRDYEPANFSRAVQYKLKRSYYVKTENGTYKKIQLFEDTKVLKYFGLGPYFYVQFMRRICWLFLFLALVEGIRIYINSKSSGLSGYSVSFSTYLIPTTLGNFNKNIITSYDAYIVALVPAFTLLCLTLFYLCWKSHFYSQIQEEDNRPSNVKPQKFCLEVVCEDQRYMSSKNLRTIFENFGPIHQISIVRRFKGHLSHFKELEKLQEQIKQEELEISFGSGDKEKLADLRTQKKAMLQALQDEKINPQVKSAYIHFQYEKSKVECLAYFNRHYHFLTCCHGCTRDYCCCCIEAIPKKFKLQEKHDLFIKNEEVAAPEDINWQSYEVSSGSKAARYIFASLIIIFFLAISCTIIGICTIYVSTHSSNCDSVTVPSTLAGAQAANDQKVKTCFCNANLISSLTDSSIKTYCSAQLQDIYIEQGVQYAIIFASTLTNFLFGLVVDKIINCTRPSSQSQSLKIKTLVYTIFLIFNSIFLPILLYSDIFGFKTSSYFSFLTLISQGISSFLQVDNLQFYLDYSPIWYRNVSPMFTNFILLDIATIWVMFIISKIKASFIGISDKEEKILQKHMNEEITSYQFSPYKEYSAFIMILFMGIFLSPGIPVLIPLAFLNLLSRYVTNRALIQQSSTRVDGLGIIFNELPHTLLPILLFVSCLNGCWMLTANTQIYPDILPFNVKLWQINNWSIMQRELYLPFYFFMAFFVLAQYVFHHTIGRCYNCIKSSCFDKKKTVHPSQTKTFTEHTKSMNILTSYNIKRNDKMRNAVMRMESYLSKEDQNV